MRNKLILTLFALLSVGISLADNDAIYVWVDGQSTCYQLQSKPKVTYGKNGSMKTVILTLQGESTPILTLPLTDEDSKLKIVYGQYDRTKDPNDIQLTQEFTDSKVHIDGKFIKGGRLIIIKDGKQYDIRGNEVK